MKPMCAFRYKDQSHTLPDLVAVQPKLNGVRALTFNNQCQSRWEKLWHINKVTHILRPLQSINPAWILDGEFYLHGTSLQKINGAMSINSSEVTPLTREIEYHIFDGFNRRAPLQPFRERFETLSAILLPLLGTTSIRLVDTHFVTQAQAERSYPSYLNDGYEGMMYRVPDSPYGHLALCTNQENRWKYLLKRKDFLDGEVRVIGRTEGEGKYEGMMGGLICLFDNGNRFTVGSGFSDQQRAIFYDDPPIDQYITIKYEMLSENGTPLKATFEDFFKQ